MNLIEWVLLVVCLVSGTLLFILDYKAHSRKAKLVDEKEAEYLQWKKDRGLE